MGVDDAERVPAARAARRLRVRRRRRRVLDGAVPARPGRSARHDRPLARVPVRERLGVEPLPPDLRLRAPARSAGTAPTRRSSPTAASASSSRTTTRACPTGSTPRAGPSAWCSGASSSRRRDRDAARRGAPVAASRTPQPSDPARYDVRCTMTGIRSGVPCARRIPVSRPPRRRPLRRSRARARRRSSRRVPPHTTPTTPSSARTTTP